MVNKDKIKESLMDQIDLEVKELAVYERVDKRVLKDSLEIDISEGGSFISNQVAVRLLKEIYGRESGEYEIRTPKTWWDRFKQDVFPYWLQKRFPAEYKTDTIKAIELFPNIPVDTLTTYNFKRGG